MTSLDRSWSINWKEIYITHVSDYWSALLQQAGVKLEEGEATGSGEMTIPLKSKVPFSGKRLQDDQMNAIYRLFSTLDVNNSGEVDADPNKIKSEA